MKSFIKSFCEGMNPFSNSDCKEIDSASLTSPNNTRVISQTSEEEKRIIAEEQEQERKANEIKALKIQMMQESVKSGDYHPAYALARKSNSESCKALSELAEKIYEYFSRKSKGDEKSLKLDEADVQNSVDYYKFVTLGKYGPCLRNNALKIEKLIKTREQEITGLNRLVDASLCSDILGSRDDNYSKKLYANGTVVASETYHLLRDAILSKYEPKIVALCKDNEKVVNSIRLIPIKELETKIAEKFQAFIKSNSRNLTKEEYQLFVRGYKMHKRGYSLPWEFKHL